MSWERKIRYLLRAALRAEDQGDRRVAETLRRMARDAVPVDENRLSVVLDPAGRSSASSS